MSNQTEEVKFFEAEYELHKKYAELISQINSSIGGRRHLVGNFPY